MVGSFGNESSLPYELFCTFGLRLGSSAHCRGHGERELLAKGVKMAGQEVHPLGAVGRIVCNGNAILVGPF